MREQEMEKWGNYFRYFYFHEEMTFSCFLDLIAKGLIPRRTKVDWSRVKSPWDERIG